MATAATTAAATATGMVLGVSNRSVVLRPCLASVPELGTPYAPVARMPHHTAAPDATDHKDGAS